MSPDEIATRAVTDGLLARMGHDHDTIAKQYTMLSRTEDYIAEMIPLLEPYLGPAETWINQMIPGGPIVEALAILLEKAITYGADKWAASRRAGEESE